MPSTDKLRMKRRVQHEIYDTFSGLLEGPAGGHVLFFPKSKDNHGGAVGDGGYIHKGSFYREFNVYSDPPPGTTPLSLPASGLSTDLVLNSPYAMRSSTSESISLGFEGSSAADAIPDIAPFEIKPEVSIHIRRYNFAFMAYCGVQREVETLLRSQQEKIVEWFIANESAVGPHPLIFVTQTVRSPGWIGGVTIDKRRDLSGQVAADTQIFSVSARASNSRATNIGLVPTHGPVLTTPWSTARSASPNYTVAMSYVMIKRGLKDRLRSMLNGLRTRTAESQDSSKPSPSESTSQSLARSQSSQQQSMAPSSSSAGHLQASFSPTTPVALDVSHKGAAADDDGSIGSELEDDDEDLDDDEDEGEDEDDDEDNDDDSVLDEKSDNTILSRILDRALRESDADIAVGDWAILKDYADRYGIVPDPFSVVLHLEVKEYGNGRTAVDVLSITRDANEPEQPEESQQTIDISPGYSTAEAFSNVAAGASSAPEVVDDQEHTDRPLAKEVVGAFDPRLNALVVALEEIHKHCLTLKQNRAQCLGLYDFCLHIVATIDTCVKNGLSLDDKTQHVEVLHQLFIQTAKDVQTISNYTFFASLLRHDSIKATITELRIKLTEGFTAFQITSLLALEKYSVEFAAAADGDRQVAEGTVALMDHKADVADNKLDNVDHKLANMDHKLDDMDSNISDMKDTIDAAMTSQHAVRLMQIHGRMEPSGSAEQAAVFADLSDLQRQTGYPPLPLVDIIDEAKKIGDSPVSHGSKATLWRGIWLGDSAVPLALKFPREPMYRTPEGVMLLHRSVQILRRLQHRNIIPLMGVKYANASASGSIAIEFIAFPWIDNGNIMAFLGRTPNADRLKLMFDVACGLKYLHDQSPPIVHRSVEPSSILVGKGGDAILSDFGYAAALDELDLKNPNPGPNYDISDAPQPSLRWLAPEVSDGQYRLPADVYSWAMTTLHVLSGVLPFPTIKQPGRVVLELCRGLRPKREDYPSPLLTDQMWDLLQRCWDQDPGKRPTMADVLKDITDMRPDLRVP